MPLYTYKCPTCSKVKEILQTIKEPAPVCEWCVNHSCGIHTPEMERYSVIQENHNLKVVDFMKLIIKNQNHQVEK